MAKKVKTKSKMIHPSEIIALYSLKKAVFFNDFKQAKSGVNQNQLKATKKTLTILADYEKRGKGSLLGIFGPMASGKTTVVCLLGERFDKKDHNIYKHKLDLTRTGNRLVNHSGKIYTQAKLFEKISDFDSSKKILIIDEFQFFTSGKPSMIKSFLRKRKKEGKHTIISQLDFNYRRDPWETTRIILPLLDYSFVLRARCSLCGQPAEFTQRNVNGKPAHINDPELIVGAEELYLAACKRCHQVRGKPPSVKVK